MTVKDREAQILRIRTTSLHPEMDSALEESLRTAVVRAVKTTLEAALEEELSTDLARMISDKPRRSGHFSRGLDTQYGHVPDLQVPKLRRRNRERDWQISRPLPTRARQSFGLAMLPIRDGTIAARPARSAIFLNRSCDFSKCRESSHPQSPATAR